MLAALACGPLLGCPSEGATTGSSEGSSSSTTAADSTSGTQTTAVDSSEGTAASESSSSSTTIAAESSGSGGSSGTGSDTSTSVAEGSSSGTTGAAGMPDLDVSVVLEQTEASIYTQTLEFSDQSCPVLDMCVGGTGARRLLRFSTITPNLGTADFHVGNPVDNPELFVMSGCGGWLFANYARYRLLDGEGNEVGNGHKSAFALIDLQPWTDDAGPAQYGFGQDMGISVGWADIYDAGLDCQWVDITGVAAGDYTLELSINPDAVIEEASYDNNVLTVPVTITDVDDVEPPPEGWVCPAQFYGTNDGCDCGCGVTDPDCVDMTADACDFCDPPGCANSCAEIDPDDNAVCV
ncbi:MAG: hypothetical protein K1X88_13475 [Nannocystaceae bacterium]|nr:hypothetical protein [Nannocystaceae bacterium]